MDATSSSVTLNALNMEGNCIGRVTYTNRNGLGRTRSPALHSPLAWRWIQGETGRRGGDIAVLTEVTDERVKTGAELKAVRVRDTVEARSQVDTGLFQSIGMERKRDREGEFTGLRSAPYPWVLAKTVCKGSQVGSTKPSPRTCSCAACGRRWRRGPALL